MILLPGCLWKLRVRGGRWAGHPGQHWQCRQGRTLSPFRNRLSLLEKRDPSRTARPQGMFLLLFIHSVLMPSSPHFVSLAGKGSPCCCHSVLSCHPSVAEGFLCADVAFPEAVLWEHSYQINLPEIHLNPLLWAASGSAKTPHSTHSRVNREPAANCKFCLYIHEICLKSLIVLVCNLVKKCTSWKKKAACNL